MGVFGGRGGVRGVIREVGGQRGVIREGVFFGLMGYVLGWR